MTNTMTSMQRVLTTLSHKEPDRVPLFLLNTMLGAKELKTDITSYFQSGEAVAEGQIKLQQKFQSDCLYAFFYAAIETEAWGGEVIYHVDGPPNAGRPIINNFQDINHIKSPNIDDQPCLQKVLQSIRIMKKYANDTIPIIGVVMSPFSLPVMQLGFDKYLDLIFTGPELFSKLMEINEKFCANWANAQLQAGATAICYFDPVSSPTIIPKNIYQKTGFLTAKRTLQAIKGPSATHLASGLALEIIPELCQTGTAVVGISANENLVELKTTCRGKISILGNLNGAVMRHWNQEDAERAVKESIRIAAPGGGFILSDNHGEIPYQVSEEVLLNISEANQKWGRYPIELH